MCCSNIENSYYLIANSYIFALEIANTDSVIVKKYSLCCSNIENSYYLIANSYIFALEIANTDSVIVKNIDYQFSHMFFFSFIA